MSVITSLSMRRVLIALCAAACLWLLAASFASTALAHATLLRADPAVGGSFESGPEAITLWFSEPVELEYSQVDILRPDGSRVSAGDLEALSDPEPAVRAPLDTALRDGSYTVVWSVLSRVDGHVSEGFFSFTVGDALPPSAAEQVELARQAGSEKVVPTGVDAAIRWLNLLGQATIAGAVVFLAFVLMPALRSAGLRTIPSRRYRRLFIVALAALIAGHGGSAIVQVMNATRSASPDILGTPLIALLTETRYGALWLSRAVLIVALGVLVWSLTRRQHLVSARGRGRSFWIAAIVVSGMLLATTSLGSHAAARGGPISWPVLTDWLHLAGTSVWVGGLVAFVLSLSPAEPGTTREIVRRFSALALGAVVVLGVTGLVAARREAVSLTGLVATRYGMWLTLKLAIVAATLGFAARHLLVVRPSLASAASGQAASRDRRFRRSLRIETVLALSVLAVTAMLTASIPARDLLDPGASLFSSTRLTREASVTLRVSPGRIGSNEFSVVVSPHDAETFGTLQRVYLRFDRVGQDAGLPAGGSQRIQLQQVGSDGSYTFLGSGAYLALDGDWTVTAIIRRAGVLDLEAPFALTATDDGLRPTELPPGAAVDRLSRIGVLGGLWLLVAVTLAAAAWRMRTWRSGIAYSLLALSALALVMGSLLMLAGGGMARL